jgi:hypothetical protein
MNNHQFPEIDDEQNKLLMIALDDHAAAWFDLHSHILSGEHIDFCKSESSISPTAIAPQYAACYFFAEKINAKVVAHLSRYNTNHTYFSVLVLLDSGSPCNNINLVHSVFMPQNSELSPTEVAHVVKESLNIWWEPGVICVDISDARSVCSKRLMRFTKVYFPYDLNVTSSSEFLPSAIMHKLGNADRVMFIANLEESGNLLQFSQLCEQIAYLFPPQSIVVAGLYFDTVPPKSSLTLFYSDQII